MRESGVHTPYMRSVYPTLTFPNHYSIVTGLYPESHGIVNNVFYDQHLNEIFTLGRPMTFDPRWWGGEPIWLTAKKQNVKAATYFWVGSDVAINGSYPDYYFKYNGSIPYEARIDKVFEWLELPESTRPGLITLYFDEPDHAGHGSGPNSQEVNEQLKRVDGIILMLVSGLKKRKMDSCVDIIIVADHGMTETSCEREVLLSCFMDVDKTFIIDGTIATINTRFHREVVNGNTVVVNTTDMLDVNKVYESLQCKSSHYRVFTKETLPMRFHYTNNDRIGDITVDVQDGWLVYGKVPRTCLAGNHGYDNLDRNMQALFVGSGPSFKQSIEVEPFENIELYNLMCYMLGITPAPNNGTYGSLFHLLSKPPILADFAECTQSNGRITPCSCLKEGKIQAPCAQGTTQLNGTIYETASYTTVFSSDFKMPLAVTAMQSGYKASGNFSLRPTCDKTAVVPSIRISTGTQNCSDQAMPIVPMYEGFSRGVWQYLWQLINSYEETSLNDFSVTAGPIFDANHDSRFDPSSASKSFVDAGKEVPLPTHYFVSLARCVYQWKTLPCDGEIEILSFILPHVNLVPNCMDYETYLLDNVARVKDIELATELELLRFLPLEERARLKVRLPTSLWASSLPTAQDKNGMTASNAPCGSGPQYNPLLLISLDGFRADYLSYNVTPNIQRLIQEGVHTPRMLSAYPTLTFPNHYTIVTGLYPESHGIVDNDMFDIGMQKAFSIYSSTKSDPRWWHGDPIWLTAQKYGKKSACYFWVGSDVPIEGKYPHYYKNYSSSVPFNDRVDTVLGWLSLAADQRPDLITLYFDEPDTTGHKLGPEPTSGLLTALQNVDNVIGRLMSGLQNLKMSDSVNILLVSDHGMGARNCTRVAKLSDYMKSDDISKIYVYTAAAARISNLYSYKSGNYTIHDTPLVSTEAIMNYLEGKSSFFTVYRKSQLPKRLHYANNIRIDDIIIKMEDDWVFCKALFIAHGPAFKEGVEVPEFENIELYSLMADLLNITASPNNGTRGSLYHTLKNPPVLQKPQQFVQCQSVQPIATNQLHRSCNCSITTAVFVPTPKYSGLLEPLMTEQQLTYCLNYTSHVSAYSKPIKMSLWTSFTVMGDNANLPDSESCLVPDSNLPTDEQNTYKSYFNADQSITAAPIFQINHTLLLAVNDTCGSVTYSSAATPMSIPLKNDLWSAVWKFVRSTANQTKPVLVTAGPIFDYNSDGLADDIHNLSKFVDDRKTIPLPSHYFVNEERRLLENVARVRDVELLTGLQFLPYLDPALSARLRTHVPTSLWAVTTTKQNQTWLEQECPPRGQADNQCPSNYRPVLLVSLDGFRPDYLHRGFSPVIDRLVTCGVHAPYMRSVYPTKTFPNHYTIVTGLYPESHGIIDNNMFDFNISQKFSLTGSIKYNPQWWGGEPLWVTAQKQKFISASYFWVGSDVRISDMTPDIFEPYNGEIPFGERVETVLRWLTLPADKRPHFITLYFDQPDHAAHEKGPFTPEVDAQVKLVDTTLGQLMDGLYQHNLHHCVNLMVVSDHGFSSLSCDKVIAMQNYFDKSSSNSLYFYYGPFGRVSNTYHYDLQTKGVKIYPGTPPLSILDVQNHLKCVDHLNVYAKTDLPKRHHYVNNNRIDNIILDPSLNWTVSSSATDTKYCTGGDHGWDNTYRAMSALFVGYGPSFQNGKTVEPFENIELYNMISDLIGMKPAPNNGTLGSLDHLLWQNFTRGRNAVSSYNSVKNSSVPLVLCNCSLKEEDIKSITEVPLSPIALPFGIPLLMETQTDVYILNHSTHVTAYSTILNSPLWVSATVTSFMLRRSETLDYNSTCVISDSRLPQGLQCNHAVDDGHNVTWTSLLPSAYKFGLSSLLLSSQVPLLNDFVNDTWMPLQEFIGNWVKDYESMNYIAGPAYDTNSDGLADTLDQIKRSNNTVPTHLFVIVARCANKSSDVTTAQCADVQTLSFILPQKDSSRVFNCQSALQYLEDNEARVRDVELITGFQFFPAIPFTQAVAMRTYLPSGLWEISSR
ncbi:hypothetical protein C0Q70_16343 [Pomacea canaliculata]|uniref:Ectonucleotide pyrophosphatase/phosphodiesterase family member 3 n=1 Tax=Pomacea canaliculata TaxID=400727 RepID=A0A2T7NPI8_POMCA|nr:hypothetical protein C0Q70_16343 [Pomacea canaliculata]